MRWSYKTEHFSLKKDGLLGSAFLDEAEIEVTLNEYGHAGWELVSFLEVNNGLIAVFKQPLSQGIASIDTAVPEEKAAGGETQRTTEKASFVPPLEGTSVAAQFEVEEEKEDLEEAGGDAADIGSIRIF